MRRANLSTEYLATIGAGAARTMEIVETAIRADSVNDFRGPRRLRSPAWADKAFEWLTRAFAFVVFSILLAILASLVIGSQLTLHKYGFSFIWSNNWDPVQEEFGALVPIFGTVVTSLIAMLIGVPVSFGIAI